MITNGKISRVCFDALTGRFVVTLDLEHIDSDEAATFEGKELDVMIKPHRNRRSLDANAYAWQLMDKIARKIGSSKEDVYEHYIQTYGAFDADTDGEPIVVTLAKRVDIGLLPGHWKMISDNRVFRSYMRLKGSSEYDSVEMNNLISYLVEEAKGLGIETLTPQELESIRKAWRG